MGGASQGRQVRVRVEDQVCPDTRPALALRGNTSYAVHPSPLPVHSPWKGPCLPGLWLWEVGTARGHLTPAHTVPMGTHRTGPLGWP